MALLVCKVDKKLVIPKAKSSFPNKEELVYDFKAGVPLEVIDEVAESYSKSYPKIYAVVGSKEPVKETVPDTPPVVPSVQFDAVKYLESNPTASEEQLKTLKQSELLALCEVLELNAHPNTGVDKLASKIAQELKVKNDAE